MSGGASDPQIGTVILAAGESARMGQLKQLLTYHGVTLLRRTAETALALGCGPVVVVLGAHAGIVRPTLSGLPVLAVENPDWRDGMATSLCAGLREILRADPAVEGVLVLLCDQPLVSATALCLLLETNRANPCLIVAAEYAGTLGVPALFARPLFAELLALTGKEGARSVIQKHRSDAAGVPMPDAAIDVDTATDFAALPFHPP